VRPFSDRQVALVQGFAAQAEIAMRNARLLTETRESLEQQTATSEILASISGSLTDPRPVFDAIVRCLLRLFGARFATVQLLRDGTVEMAAADGQVAIDKIMAHYPRPLDDTTVGGQAMLSKQVVQYAPVIGNPIVPPAAQQIARDYQYTSIIAAPMIRQDKVVGAIVCGNPEPRVFDAKEVALIKSFADQAVIAIENARLLTELRQRTDDLTESLEQQTATSEVLQVISSSPRRSRAGVRDIAREGHRHLRRQLWQHLPLGRRPEYCLVTQHAAGLCRGAKAIVVSRWSEKYHASSDRNENCGSCSRCHGIGGLYRA
jgi:GAF domain-containing protein